MHFFMKRFLLMIILSAAVLSSRAQIAVAKIFSDHMVLQRNQQVPVWGWIAKNKKVAVHFNGQFITVKADETGYWKALLKPMPEGGPFEMEITSDKEKL